MIALTLFATPALAQTLDLPSLSPRAEVMQTVGIVEMRVNYSSPAKRDRTIWGELVPYGKLWRSGANMATTLESTGAFQLGDTEVPAGTYALFTIPGEESWTVILNSNANQGGTGSYDEGLDVARLQVSPLPGGERERLTFVFSDTTGKGTRLDLMWDGVKVPIPISVDTMGMVAGNVAEFVSSSSSQLTAVARHYNRVGENERALELVNEAIDLEESWYNVWIKATIHKAMDQRGPARRAAKRAKKLGDSAADDFVYKERVEKAIREW